MADLTTAAPAPLAPLGDLSGYMDDLGRRARDASVALKTLTAKDRSAAIAAMADALIAGEGAILAANAEDVSAAKVAGLDAAKTDRLVLTPDRLAGVAAALKTVAGQDDPVGAELARWRRPNGLDIARVATPIGVIAIIYESRPNVTADAAALCLRAGNAVILRGGSEAARSNTAIHAALAQGLEQSGAPRDAVQFVATTDREAVGRILRGLDGAVDLIIPRGGKSLVARVQEEARAPVLGHLEGRCHVYVHAGADIETACAIVVNAKMRRTGICGAAETLLVDAVIADQALPVIAGKLIEAGCALRGDAAAQALVPGMEHASEADWHTEYLAPVLSVRVVADIAAAMAHIRQYGSEHTEAIITEDLTAAELFLHEVDSAIVMHNASTQFADGGEFGMGAEIGIATGRLHARGPVGADQLTTFKYVVRGEGQVRP